MLERLFGNPHYKLVSLLVALLAWLYVQSDEVATGQIQAKVAWELADGLVSVETLPRNVALQVRGTRAAIRRARVEGATLPVDLRDLGPGEHSLELGPFSIEGLDGKVEVLSRTPSGLRFRLDQEITRKVAVKPRIVGKPAEGYAVGRLSLVPAVVAVTGPASVVGRLGEVATEPIDVAGTMADLEAPSTLALPSRAVADVDGVVATVQVVALNERRRFDDVPVQVFGRRGTVVPAVTSVELVGPSSAVGELDPSDVVVFIDAPDTYNTVRATFGKTGPATVRVLHGAGREVHAATLTPNTFEVTR